MMRAKKVGVVMGLTAVLGLLAAGVGGAIPGGTSTAHAQGGPIGGCDVIPCDPALFWFPDSAIETHVVVEPRLRVGNRLLKDSVSWSAGTGCPGGICWPRFQYRVYWGQYSETVVIDPFTGGSSNPTQHPNIRVHSGIQLCDGATLSSRRDMSASGCLKQVDYGFDVHDRVNGQTITKIMALQQNPQGPLDGRAFAQCPLGQIFQYAGPGMWHEISCKAVEFYAYLPGQ